jgi:hypothetical protein
MTIKDLLIQAVRLLLTLLTPELVKGATKHLLDWARQHVLGTASTVDDKLVLPVIDTIEAAFDLDDEDDN